MKQMLDIKAVNKYKHKPDTEGEREFRELDLGSTPLKLCEGIWMYMKVFSWR